MMLLALTYVVVLCGLSDSSLCRRIDFRQLIFYKLAA